MNDEIKKQMPIKKNRVNSHKTHNAGCERDNHIKIKSQ